MAATFDVGTNSGEKTSVSSYTFTHTTGNLVKGLLVVAICSRGGASANTDPNVTAVTYAGLNLTKAVEKNDLDVASATLCISIWYMTSPPAGANTVSITFSGTTNFSVAYSGTYSGIDQIKPLDTTASSTALGQGSPNTTSLTTRIDNALLIDGIYNKIGTSLTRGANQNLVAAEVFPNSSGDTVDSSYKILTTSAAANSMSWTFTGSDDYCQAVASFRPQTPLPNNYQFVSAGNGISVSEKIR